MSLEYYRQLDKNSPVVLACVDDRGYQGDEQFLQVGAGGPVALAAGLIAARYLDGHEVTMPLGEVSKIITATLHRQLGVVACTHHDCAGEAAAAKVGTLLKPHDAYDMESIERGLAVYGGDIPESTIEQLYQGFSTLPYRGVEQEAVHMDSAGQHPAIDRRRLVHNEHAAQQLEVVYDASMGALTAERYEANPSYGLNVGALELASRAITTTLPHDTDTFIMAMSLHTGAIAGALPGDVKIVPLSRSN